MVGYNCYCYIYIHMNGEQLLLVSGAVRRSMAMKLAVLGCLATSATPAWPNGLHSMLGKTMAGDIKPLADFEGKPVLMVNVASR